MTRTQFVLECNNRLIDFNLACENEKIAAALKADKHDDTLIINLLDSEF